MYFGSTLLSSSCTKIAPLGVKRAISGFTLAVHERVFAPLGLGRV